jgi:type II secretory pathway pseudopilin PulG
LLDNGDQDVPTRDRRPRVASTPVEGFTFVELLVAVTLGAAVLSAAVLAFQTIGQSRSRIASYGAVGIGASAYSDFYSGSSNSVRTWFAPNYGRIANAVVLREMFLEDVQRATAVYCLPRAGRSTIRPISFALTGAYAVTNFDTRRLDTPEAFRQFLADTVPGANAIFTEDAYAAEGAVRGENLSIFVILPSDDPALLTVFSIYEVDFVRSTSPAGTYATVRRYQGATPTIPTHSYDIFYPDMADGTAVNATDFYVAASFERAGRPGTTSPLLSADRDPFYFLWWPDPAATRLPEAGTEYLDVMAGQTSFFMVVPMFPSL